MVRTGIALTCLAALNIIAALAVTLWFPSAPMPALPPAVPHLTGLPGTLSIPATPARFEGRVRRVIRQEMQQAGLPAGDPGLRAPEIERERDRTLLRSGPGEVRAVLTPFGLYRSGIGGFVLMLMTFGSLLAAGAASLYLLPERLRNASDAIAASRRGAARLGAIGLLVSLLSLLLCFLLASIVTGIVFAAIVLLVLAAALFLGLMVIALVLGGWIRERLALRRGPVFLDLALGLLVLFPLGLIPWLGWVIMLLITAIGAGAVFATRFGSRPPWPPDRMDPPDALLRA